MCYGLTLDLWLCNAAGGVSFYIWSVLQGIKMNYFNTKKLYFKLCRCHKSFFYVFSHFILLMRASIHVNAPSISNIVPNKNILQSCSKTSVWHKHNPFLSSVAMCLNFREHMCSCENILTSSLCLTLLNGLKRAIRGPLLLLYRCGWEKRGAPMTHRGLFSNPAKHFYKHLDASSRDTHKLPLRLVTRGWARLCEETRCCEKG